MTVAVNVQLPEHIPPMPSVARVTGGRARLTIDATADGLAVVEIHGWMHQIAALGRAITDAASDAIAGDVSYGRIVGDPDRAHTAGDA